MKDERSQKGRSLAGGETGSPFVARPLPRQLGCISRQKHGHFPDNWVTSRGKGTTTSLQLGHVSWQRHNHFPVIGSHLVAKVRPLPCDWVTSQGKGTATSL